MRISIVALLAIAGLLLCVDAQWFGGKKSRHERILFDDVRAITLKKGHMTTGRRNSPVPQLSCVGGSACKASYEPSSVLCQHMGNEQWKCEADLDKAVKFGDTTVTCEGFEDPDDRYILKGSCGLEYTLEYTGYSRGGHSSGYGGYHSYSTDNTSSGGSGIFKFIIFCVAVYLIYSIFRQLSLNNEQRQRAAGGFGYGPGGPGGGGPYGPGAYQPPPPGCAPGMTQPPPAGGWQPGFWTGLGLGGFLSNMFRPRTYGYGGYYGGGWGSGWGSGWGQPHHGWGGRSSFGGSFGGGGGGTRTASGFGGTRRR
eukprot:TRINITY_DN3772_c0_g1_i1.p1 TRINITY_DN3772_c0_g1~~TRINITY_DN3772_c0_g1_i1.p1  ORF type:complete len:310 (+),score=31.60 TRINITY_DN3772_c0_g1_i1:108-1037(+)